MIRLSQRMLAAAAGMGAFCALSMGALGALAALPPVPVPAENPITEPKRVLGKILFWDERLTTREAQRALRAAGKNTKQSKKMIDQVAAQILLQNYLDSLQWARLSNA